MALDEATRRPRVGCNCSKGLIRVKAPVVMNWRGRRAELPLTESHKRSLPFFIGESTTSRVLDPLGSLGASCQANSCLSSAHLYCSSVIHVST